MALSQRCFSAQPAFPWGNACMGSLEGKNPTSTPPGQGRIAPGCFDLERSAPLGWDQGQTRGPDGSRGRGGNPSPPPAPLPAVLQAAGSRSGTSHPTSKHTSLSWPRAGFHPRAPKTESGLRFSVSAAAGLQPSLCPTASCWSSAKSQERRQGEAAPSTGHTCPGQPSFPRHTPHGED